MTRKRAGLFNGAGPDTLCGRDRKEARRGRRGSKDRNSTESNEKADFGTQNGSKMSKSGVFGRFLMIFRCFGLMRQLNTFRIF